MKKSVKSLSFVLAGMLLLAGCGSKETASSTKKDGAEKEFKVGITQFAVHPSLDAATEGFKKALQDKGIKVKYDEQKCPSRHE